MKRSWMAGMLVGVVGFSGVAQAGLTILSQSYAANGSLATYDESWNVVWSLSAAAGTRDNPVGTPPNVFAGDSRDYVALTSDGFFTRCELKWSTTITNYSWDLSQRVTFQPTAPMPVSIEFFCSKGDYPEQAILFERTGSGDNRPIGGLGGGYGGGSMISVVLRPDCVYELMADSRGFYPNSFPIESLPPYSFPFAFCTGMKICEVPVPSALPLAAFGLLLIRRRRQRTRVGAAPRCVRA